MILNKIYKYSDNKCINLSNLLYKSCKNYSLSNSNKKLNNTILFNENNKLKILNSNNNNLKKIEMHESHSPTAYLIKN